MKVRERKYSTKREKCQEKQKKAEGRADFSLIQGRIVCDDAAPLFVDEEGFPVLIIVDEDVFVGDGDVVYQRGNLIDLRRRSRVKIDVGQPFRYVKNVSALFVKIDHLRVFTGKKGFKLYKIYWN